MEEKSPKGNFEKNFAELLERERELNEEVKKLEEKEKTEENPLKIKEIRQKRWELERKIGEIVLKKQNLKKEFEKLKAEMKIKKRLEKEETKQKEMGEKEIKQKKEVLKEKATNQFQQAKKIKGQMRIWKKLTSIGKSPIIGIDISDYSIEVLCLDQKKRLLAYGRSILEEGIVQDGMILEQKKLVDVLKETLRNTKPQPLITKAGTELKAVFSLPESKTYTQYFSFKDKANLSQKIQKKIQETVPVIFEDLYYDFIKINNQKNGAKVLCVAAKKEIVEGYIYLLRVAGITPIAFETESISIARALLPKVYGFGDDKEVFGENTVILDIGGRISTISIHNKEGMMCLAVSLPYAGIYFTQKIAEDLQISFPEAEEKKIVQGFKENTEIFPILQKASQKIIDEVKNAINFFEKEFGAKINKIILAGGSALLPEIDKFFQKHFTAKVEIGNPLAKIEEGEKLEKGKELFYSNVIGLALRGISEDPIKAGINLLPTDIKIKERRVYQEVKVPVLVGTLFFALFGIALLLFSIFYVRFLPVPPEMIPLKQRILLRLPPEKQEEVTIIIKVADEFAGLEIPVYSEADENTSIVEKVTNNDSLELLEKKENWIKIKVRDKEGWIKAEYILLNP